MSGSAADYAVVDALFMECGVDGEDFYCDMDPWTAGLYSARYCKVGEMRYYYTLREHVLYVWVRSGMSVEVSDRKEFNLADPGVFDGLSHVVRGLKKLLVS